MKRSDMTIGILCLSAALLVVLHWFLPTGHAAEVTVKERNYSVVSARIASGGDGLYIMDNSTGVVAVFTYDPSTRNVQPRQVKPIGQAFITR
jgi:hypothetical protein